MMLYIVVGVVVVSVLAGIIIVLRGFSSFDGPEVPVNDPGQFRTFKKDDSLVKMDTQFKQTPFNPPPPKPPVLTQHLMKENLAVKSTPAAMSKPPLTQTLTQKPVENIPVAVPKPLTDVLPPVVIQSQPVDPQPQPVAGNKVENIVKQETSEFQSKRESTKKDLEEKIAKLTKERDELNDALVREMKSKDAQTILVEENVKLLEKSKQVDDLQKSLNTLSRENYQLSRQIEEEKGRNIDADEKSKLLTERLATLEKDQIALTAEVADKERMYQTLRDELLNKTKSGNDSMQELVLLKPKLAEAEVLNQALQQKLDTLNNSREIQFSQNEYTFEQMQQEKERLIFQLKVSELKLEELQKTIELLRQNFEPRSKFQVDQNQSSVSQGNQKESIDQKLEWAVLNLEEMKKEKEKLYQANADLESRLTKIREHNAMLLKKESMLHYELSKSRAQAIGLEKICMSLKDQLHQVSKSSGAG